MDGFIDDTLRISFRVLPLPARRAALLSGAFAAVRARYRRPAVRESSGLVFMAWRAAAGQGATCYCRRLSAIQAIAAARRLGSDPSEHSGGLLVRGAASRRVAGNRLELLQGFRARL